MSGLDVDTDAVDKGGAALEDVAEKLKIMREEYVDKISSYRGCWGTGEFGEAFATKYYQGLDPTVGGLDALCDATEASGRSLGGTGKKFKKVQQDVIDQMPTPKRNA
ncbi:hypothetical protein [Streptomyces qinzhouensis]|uniref:WXG100 family type VII secretion target n=1 Tax=Streptomyces qinzhouensis TaxID=2599401 RepID=A0A5B8JJZ3_9ACTN|nr:hypothetical protein [Streptomyces qinzhouensis]QDY80221.1 hypothetical protein FQU76_31095 [Streptomyces qinzhouensis]